MANEGRSEEVRGCCVTNILALPPYILLCHITALISGGIASFWARTQEIRDTNLDMLSVYKQLITSSSVVRPVPSGSSPRTSSVRCRTPSFIRSQVMRMRLLGEGIRLKPNSAVWRQGRKSWKFELLVWQHGILLLSVSGIGVDKGALRV